MFRFVTLGGSGIASSQPKRWRSLRLTLLAMVPIERRDSTDSCAKPSSLAIGKEMIGQLEASAEHARAGLIVGDGRVSTGVGVGVSVDDNYKDYKYGAG